MLAVRQQVSAIYADRSTQRWIVRASEGKFWSLFTDEGGWERRQPFEPAEEADLLPIPGHYKYLLRLPF
jgi:hypothetical protein